MHRTIVKEGSRVDRKLKQPTTVTSSRSAVRNTTTAPRVSGSCGDADDCGDHIDDEVLRARVRQRIQQRVWELQAMDAPTAKVIEAPPPFMDALHQDVVQTAAQILGRYLASAHQNDEPLELTLVHRLLVKEVELQALQLQRTPNAQESN